MNTLTTGRHFPTLLTILDELKKAGRFNEGFHILIANKPYMPLAIEDICDPGPDGHRVISVTHYGKQNGDLMRDPEMLFQLVETESTMMLHPFYYRNDYVGIEEWSRWREDGRLLVRLVLNAQHRNFASVWDNNLKDQGFLEAFRQTLISR